ncbi:MAG: NUDIX hydrolase [Bacilli bacterium]|nr:NUDIX hydrolase [Bacilli bacterium]
MNLRLRDEIEEYVPFDEAEEKIKKYLLRWIESFDDVLTRENEFGHFTSSAFVINKDRTKMLVVYHNIFGAWVFPGGHADGEEDLLSVAIREVKEETNLKTKVLEKDIFAISASPIIGHVKRGKYVPAHTHLDVVYLLEASENDELAFRSDESKGVKWMTFEEAVGDDVVDFIRPVHRRIIEKLKSEKYSNL